MEEPVQPSEPNRTRRWRSTTVVPVVVVVVLVLFGLGFLGGTLIIGGDDGPSDDVAETVIDTGAPRSTTGSEPTTTTEPPVSSVPRILRPGEVLGVPFGTSMTSAEPRLTEILGPPTVTGHGDFEGGECRITGYGDLWVAYFRAYVGPSLDYELGRWLVTTGVDGWELENGVTIGTPTAELLDRYPEAQLRDWEESGWSGWNTTYRVEDLDFELDPVELNIESIGSPWIEFCPPYDLGYHHEPGSDEVRADFEDLVSRHCNHQVGAVHARRIDGTDRHVVTTDAGSTVVFDRARGFVDPPGGPENLAAQDLMFCDAEVFRGTISH